MVAGLKVVRRCNQNEQVERRPSAELELLARQGTVEVTRQRIAKGKIFYLDAASEWEGFEFFYLLAGTLL